MNISPATPDAPLAGADEAPTGIRFRVLGYLCSLSFVLYLDRVCIGQAVVPIQKELGLCRRQIGYALSAFTLAYGLFEVPTGRWGDRYGSRGVLTRIVVWWSAFTALTGAAIGLADAGRRAIPVRRGRGRRLSQCGPRDRALVSHVAARRGAGLMLTSASRRRCSLRDWRPILIEDVGWRWTFVAFSVVGLVWAVVFYRWFRDDPADIRHERGRTPLIAAGRATTTSRRSTPRIPWRSVLANRNIWLLGTLQTCSAAALHVHELVSGLLAAGARRRPMMPVGCRRWCCCGAAIGCLASGFINDWLARITISSGPVSHLWIRGHGGRRRWRCGRVCNADRPGHQPVGGRGISLRHLAAGHVLDRDHGDQRQAPGRDLRIDELDGRARRVCVHDVSGPLRRLDAAPRATRAARSGTRRSTCTPASCSSARAAGWPSTPTSIVPDVDTASE